MSDRYHFGHSGSFLALVPEKVFGHLVRTPSICEFQQKVGETSCYVSFFAVQAACANNSYFCATRPGSLIWLLRVVKEHVIEHRGSHMDATHVLV